MSTIDKERNILNDLLSDDEDALSTVGDEKCDYRVISSERINMGDWWHRWTRVIVKSPSGNYFKWHYATSFIQDFEDEPYDGVLTLVKPEEYVAIRWNDVPLEGVKDI